MSDLGQAASKIGEKIVDILDVFDLSFFISGAVGIGAMLLTFPDEAETLLGIGHDEGASGAVIFGLVLGTYVVGLIAFALGRPLRDWVFKRIERDDAKDDSKQPSHLVFHEALEHQCAQDERLTGYVGHYFAYDLGDSDKEKRKAAYGPAYTRMWAHLRSYPDLAESFTLVKRYWTLAATYDGVSIAVLLWLAPGVRIAVEATEPGLAILAIVSCLLLPVLTWYCAKRARIYKRYQIEEIVATIAHWFALVGRSTLHELEKTGAISPVPAPAPAGSPER